MDGALCLACGRSTNRTWSGLSEMLCGYISKVHQGRSLRGRRALFPRLGMPGRMVAVTGQSPSPDAPQSLSVLEAVLERITYANEDTGYTIARVATERTGPDLLTVVGPLLGAQVGESLRLTGRWSSHPRYGRQFEVHSYTTVLPATIQGIRRYLGSGLIKGIGPVMAERMVAHFGTGILAVIETEPGRLIEVHGLGPKRTKKIAGAWEEQKAIKEVMVFLSGVGVSTSLAVRIYKKYAGASITIVKNEPYRLASEVWGIGFKTADTIAQAVGIPHDSPERIRAGLQYTLSQAADNGHCYLPQPNLITDATKILEVDRELIGPCLDELVAAEGVVRELVPGEGGGLLPAVYLVAFHRAEQSLATGLLALLNSRQERLPAFAAVDWSKALRWLHARTRQDLAPEQQEAAQLALTQKVAVLTGGPGCGKSFTVRSIVELATAKNATVVLVAPTGRAAKRLAELTGHEACTVHRLLELQPGGDPKYDRDNPLDADLVVVDESSMMDVILANKLVKAIPAGAHLLMVGDVDQLPSVGAGEVLRDLLAGIFNGTVGVVTGLSLEEQTLTVLTDEDEPVDYDFAELDELAHAYAVTIHRSQGSEYPAVVIPLTASSWMMLRRNLLYTGVTRARKLIILAGSRRALAQAVRTPGAGRRHTALTHRLHPAG